VGRPSFSSGQEEVGVGLAANLEGTEIGDARNFDHYIVNLSGFGLE